MTNPQEMFSQPAAAGSYDLEAHLGNLVLIYPTEKIIGMATVHGASDAIKASVITLDGPDAGQEEENVLFFQKVIVSTLTAQLGKGTPVLGRIGKGAASPGKSPAWIIDSYTEADAAIATSYLLTRGNPHANPQTGEVAPAADKPALDPGKLALAKQLAATPGIDPEVVANASGISVKELQDEGVLPF